MANVLSSALLVAGQQFAVSNGLKAGDSGYNQSIRAYRAVFAAGAAINIADTLEIARAVPAGVIFLYGTIAVPVSLGTTQIRIGEGTISSAGTVTYTAGARGTYRAAATVTANEVFQSGLVTELGELAAPTSVFGTVSVAAFTPVSGTNPVVITLYYSAK